MKRVNTDAKVEFPAAGVLSGVERLGYLRRDREGTTVIARDELSRSVRCEESLFAHTDVTVTDQHSFVRHLPLQCGIER